MPSDTMPASAGPELDPGPLRAQFPILGENVRGHRLVYLDNAATTQKPRRVIDSISEYYETTNANIHRGVHLLSQRATERYEDARELVSQLVNAATPREIVFVRGATEGINLVASSFGALRVRSGDEIVVSAMEHHSNIVPWQLLCQRTGARLRVAPISDDGDIDLDAYSDLLNARTRLVAVVHVSNTLGAVNPVARMSAMAHAAGAAVLIDGAQSLAHLPVDVRALGCDFYVGSAHKLYGPTGVGFLYGREALLDAMPPYQGGGDMIASVTFEETTYNELPAKFEAGTPHIAGAIGFGEAIRFVRDLGLTRVAAHEKAMTDAAVQLLSGEPGIRVIGMPAERSGIVSFVMDGVHPHDIGTILDTRGIAIRTGHHCTQPLMKRLGLPATARASFAAYNTLEDVQSLICALREVAEVFK